jgi:hypothetical protein
MRQILHILTKPGDAVAQSVIEAERSMRDTKIEIIELSEKTDYAALAQEIFKADSIQVW